MTQDGSSRRARRSSRVPPETVRNAHLGFDGQDDGIKSQEEQEKDETTSMDRNMEENKTTNIRGTASPDSHDGFMTAPNAALTLIQPNRRRRYRPLSQTSVYNSLLPLVGFMELANAGDFAANVFNQIPVPTFAAALMGVGGCLALSFSIVALWDAKLSWRNIVLLRAERQVLLREMAQRRQEPSRLDESEKYLSSPGQVTGCHALETYLEVNCYETNTELIDRLAMDVTMGFGALLVGAGTLLAIGGANPRVFHASNLLSGYVGNGPAALYGVARLFWSIYVWRRANRHQSAMNKNNATSQIVSFDPAIPTNGSYSLTTGDSAAARAFVRRCHRVKFYALFAGPTSLVAGAASLITATRWWGYPILLPCIFLSLFCNWYFRKEIGYQRPIFVFEEGGRTTGGELFNDMDEDRLVQDLEDTISLRGDLETTTAALSSAFIEPDTDLGPQYHNSNHYDLLVQSTMQLLSRLDLWETFYTNLLSSPTCPDKILSCLGVKAAATKGSVVTIADPRGDFSLLATLSLPSSSSALVFSATIPTTPTTTTVTTRHPTNPSHRAIGRSNHAIPEPNPHHESVFSHLMIAAHSTLSTRGSRHAVYRERYLIEFLGCWLHRGHQQNHDSH